MRTERELPPIMVGPDYLCKNFYVDNKYFNLHGGKTPIYGMPFSHLFTELKISPIEVHISAIQLEISPIQLNISKSIGDIYN